MYNPAPFAEHRVEAMHEFMRRYPLATVVSSGASDGIQASHVPVLLDSEKGFLRCHMARANGHQEALRKSASVLVIFQNPGNYISPSWYPSKAEHGRVVPTWNYLAVHVRGRARIFEDSAQVIEHVRALTSAHEAGFETPWSVDDAPADYIQALSRKIVGVEISVDAIEGKWKVSQNRGEADRDGVVEGLRRKGLSEMAGFVVGKGFGDGI
jgi:transcriptional regulator